MKNVMGNGIFRPEKNDRLFLMRSLKNYNILYCFWCIKKPAIFESRLGVNS